MTSVRRLSISEERSSDSTVVSASGEIDAFSAPRFAAALSKAAGGVDGALVVDLTRVDFMDSRGFAALLNADRKLRERTGTLLVVCPRGPVRRFLTLLDLHRRLRVVP